MKVECEKFGAEVRQESHGIKSVVTNVRAAHGQALGQRIEHIENNMEEFGGNGGGNSGGLGGGENIIGSMAVKDMLQKAYVCVSMYDSIRCELIRFDLVRFGSIRFDAN